MHNTPNLVGLQKVAGIFDNNDTPVEDALEKLIEHPKGLRAAAKYLDGLNTNNRRTVEDLTEKYKQAIPGTLGTLLGAGTGAGVAGLLSARHKLSLPAGLAALLGGTVLGGASGRLTGDALGEYIRNA